MANSGEPWQRFFDSVDAMKSRRDEEGLVLFMNWISDGIAMGPISTKPQHPNILASIYEYAEDAMYSIGGYG
jgi:hypothetical protein